MENAFITIHLTSNVDVIHFMIENNFDSNEISDEKGIGLDKINLIEGNRIHIEAHKIPIGQTYKNEVNKLYNN
jgi:hypothetical protein